MTIDDLSVKLYADGAQKAGMLEMAAKPYIKGFTTNPTLMRKAGISDYVGFAKDILTEIKELPISFEVFSDDFDEMQKQASEIKSWGDNVFVKIPIMNTKGEPAYDLINNLSQDGTKLNVTAVMTLEQVQAANDALAGGADSIVSVFAGRIADTGVDPVEHMKKALDIIKANKNIELLWASPRELLNIIQANDIGCHIITATNDILNKLKNLNKDLLQFSQETVKMFYDDAQSAGFKI